MDNLFAESLREKLYIKNLPPKTKNPIVKLSSGFGELICLSQDSTLSS